MDKDWSHHNQIAQNKIVTPSTTLSKVLELNLVPDGLAIDLGCGTGADTIALLDKGWQVLAIDHDQQSLHKLKSLYPSTGLEINCQKFENLIIPSSKLVNASFSLPFCALHSFDKMWLCIKNSLQAGGYFSGHFFGLRDSWFGNPDMTFYNTDEIAALFNDFDMIWQEETERDGKTLGGGLKHWHVFHITARKS